MTDDSESVSEFDQGYWIEADSEETKNKIMSDPDLCHHAKKLLELFYEVDRFSRAPKFCFA